MKNVHLIPTDKPSRLFIDIDDNKLKITEPLGGEYMMNQHIYITSDEEIKEGDWWIRGNGNYGIRQCTKSTETDVWDKTGQYSKDINQMWKIILTTDPKLIADSVQAITNTFAEWFVKNPSCEYVDFEKEHDDTVPYLKMRYCKPYIITIPKTINNETIQTH